MPEEISDIEFYYKKAIKYNSHSRRWKYVNATIGILGIASSCMAASSVLPCFAPHCSVIAAICFGIIGFVNPSKQAIKYDRAANMINLAVGKYKCKIIDSASFLDTYENALAILTDEVESKLPSK